MKKPIKKTKLKITNPFKQSHSCDIYEITNLPRHKSQPKSEEFKLLNENELNTLIIYIYIHE